MKAEPLIGRMPAYMSRKFAYDVRHVARVSCKCCTQQGMLLTLLLIYDSKALTDVSRAAFSQSHWLFITYKTQHLLYTIKHHGTSPQNARTRSFTSSLSSESAMLYLSQRRDFNESATPSSAADIPPARQSEQGWLSPQNNPLPREN
jgi:hypothetical protein